MICETTHQLMARARAWAWAKLGGEPRFFDDVPALDKFHETIKGYRAPDQYFTQRTMMLLNERADWTGVDIRLQWFAGKLLTELRSRSIPAYVHTAFRSQQLQQELHRAGYSTVKSGAHQRGAAVDIVSATHHWNSHDHWWKYVGLLGESIASKASIPITWGGRWKEFPDPAHWELKDWRVHPLILDHEEKLTLTPAQLLKNGAPQLTAEQRVYRYGK